MNLRVWQRFVMTCALVIGATTAYATDYIDPSGFMLSYPEGWFLLSGSKVNEVREVFPPDLQQWLTKNKIDLLFMVDNSPGTSPKVAELNARFPALAKILADFGMNVAYETVVDEFQKLFFGPNGNDGLMQREVWIDTTDTLT